MGGQNCRPLDVIGQKSRNETVKIWRTKPRKKTIGSKPKKSEVHNAAPPRRQTCTACVFGVQDTVAVRLRRGGAADGERGLNTPADSPSSRISRSKHRLGGSVAGGGWGCAGGREWASPPTPRGRAMGGGHLGGAGSGGCAGHGAGSVGAHLLALLIVIAITDAPWACRRVGPPSSCREGGKPRGVRQTRTFGQKRACFPRTQQRKRCAARVHISKHMRGTRSVHAIRARDPCGETHVAVRGRDLEGRRLVCRKRGHIFKIWHEGRRGKTGGGGVHTRTIAMAPPPPVCAVTCFVANPASSRLRVPRRPLPGAQADKTRPLYSNARRRGPSDPFPPTPASGGRRLGGRFSSRSHFSLSVVVRLDRRHRQSTGLGDGRTPGFVAGA